MADRDDSPKGLRLFNNFLVPNERIAERTQGCWNCKHSVPAKAWWTQQRQRDLQTAVSIAQENPRLGEEHPHVVNIRRMVDKTDHEVAQGILARCGKNPKGKSATGDEVGDLVHTAFLCDGWSAASGASVARAGQKADKLPEELMERLDGPDAVKKRPLN